MTLYIIILYIIIFSCAHLSYKTPELQYIFCSRYDMEIKISFSSNTLTCACSIWTSLSHLYPVG